MLTPVASKMRNAQVGFAVQTGLTLIESQVGRDGQAQFSASFDRRRLND